MASNPYTKAKGGSIAIQSDGSIWTKAYDGDPLTGPGWTRPLGSNMLQHSTDEAMLEREIMYIFPPHVAERHRAIQQARTTTEADHDN